MCLQALYKLVQNALIRQVVYKHSYYYNYKTEKKIHKNLFNMIRMMSKHPTMPVC